MGDLEVEEFEKLILEEYNSIEERIKSDTKMAEKKSKIVKELFNTEETYFKSLKIVSDNFVSKLSPENSKKSIISSYDLKRIFGNWKNILLCHQDLLESLESRYKSWDEYQIIGDILGQSKMNSMTQLYKYYINNFDRSVATLQYIKSKNSDFSKFIDSTEKKSGNNLNLGAYLIMPVQRIPRYVLLFSELFKATPIYHPDYELLINALEGLKGVAQFINISKANAEKLNEAKKECSPIERFPMEDLYSIPGIRFVKKGVLYTSIPVNTDALTTVGSSLNSSVSSAMVDTSSMVSIDGEMLIEYFVVLLNNSIIFAEGRKDTKKNTTSYEFRKTVKLLGSQAYLEDDFLVIVPPADDNLVLNRDDVQTLKFTHPDETELEHWNMTITKAINQALSVSDQDDNEGAKAGVSTEKKSISTQKKKKPIKDVDKKRKIVDGLVQNEVQYVHNLKGLKIFIESDIMDQQTADPSSMKSSKRSKSKSSSSTSDRDLLIQFFDSVKPIIGTHLALIERLFVRMSEWENKNRRIGDILITFLDSLTSKYHLYALLWEEIKPIFASKREQSAPNSNFTTSIMVHLSNLDHSSFILSFVHLHPHSNPC
eukprot:TRINITY_DN3520_c0_g1_i2.p1 TRINITY_DN3520_c0_g1~~TRINITY_DN3520_c0_g1_i2.p1  ORF type:complete len:605 (+),score=113.47 TRINITY_DN3520_c0_g1_i2:23-1816(+)